MRYRVSGNEFYCRLFVSNFFSFSLLYLSFFLILPFFSFIFFLTSFLHIFFRSFNIFSVSFIFFCLPLFLLFSHNVSLHFYQMLRLFFFFPFLCRNSWIDFYDSLRIIYISIKTIFQSGFVSDILSFIHFFFCEFLIFFFKKIFPIY